MNVKKGKWLVILLAIAMLAAVGSAGISATENNNDVECVRYGQGYWKQWLAEQDENWVCTLGFSAEQLLDWLNTPARGNATQILLYQFIAASLNIGQYGCEMPPVVQEAYGDALTHLVKYLEDGIGTTEDRSVILEWKDILEFWNENKYAELLSVEYVGTCNKYGSHLGETLTLTFTNDVFILFDDQVSAEARVEFENAYRLGHNPNYMEWVADGNQVTITVVGTFGTNPIYGARPEVGDIALTLRGIVDFIEEPAVVPDDGVEVVKVGGKCLVDTVEVNSLNLQSTPSYISLEEGVNYQLKAMGVADAGDTIDFDASYSITKRINDDTWTNTVTGYESYGEALLGLHVDGDFPDWGDFNEDHIYYLDYVGTNNPVQLWIWDIYYPNNVGSLIVEIYKVW